MSQATKLPSMLKIELSVRQMRPPLNQDGSSPQLVGALDDGSPIYYGDVFLGSLAFGHVAHDGHERSPAKGPDGEDYWRLNKATGQKITQVFRSSRTYGKLKYVMRDFGNGNAGPIPVPSMSPDEMRRRQISAEFDTLKDVLAAEGMSLTDFISLLKKNAADAGESPLHVDAGEDEGDEDVEQESDDQGAEEPPKKRRGRPPKARTG